MFEERQREKKKWCIRVDQTDGIYATIYMSEANDWQLLLPKTVNTSSDWSVTDKKKHVIISVPDLGLTSQ